MKRGLTCRNLWNTVVSCSAGKEELKPLTVTLFEISLYMIIMIT